MQTIVFSRNRAAQLDLLLRSIEKRASTLFRDVAVLYKVTNKDYLQGYARTIDEHPSVTFMFESDFVGQLNSLLRNKAHDHVVFLCDDDLVIRKWTDTPPPEVFLDVNPACLGFSLRLGLNITSCYPLKRVQNKPKFVGHFYNAKVWDWTEADADWGYPGSLDGHVFRREQLLKLLDGTSYSNPNELEDSLINRCLGAGETHPYMASYESSLITGIPVNRVNDTHPNRYGDYHPMTPQALNTLYLNGRRLALDKIDRRDITAAHTELPLIFA